MSKYRIQKRQDWRSNATQMQLSCARGGIVVDRSETVTMRFLSHLFITSILAVSLAPRAYAEINPSGVMGFQSWKTSRIDEARTTLEKIQSDSQTDKPQSARPLEAKKNFQKYQQAQLNLQIVQELTLADYFTLYLSQLKDRSTRMDAAHKLSPDEIADLIAAYQKAITTTSLSLAPEAGLPLLATPSLSSKPSRIHD